MFNINCVDFHYIKYNVTYNITILENLFIYEVKENKNITKKRRINKRLFINLVNEIYNLDTIKNNDYIDNKLTITVSFNDGLNTSYDEEIINDNYLSNRYENLIKSLQNIIGNLRIPFI